jgi:hypothetical protein
MLVQQVISLLQMYNVAMSYSCYRQSIITKFIIKYLEKIAVLKDG